MRKHYVRKQFVYLREHLFNVSSYSFIWVVNIQNYTSFMFIIITNGFDNKFNSMRNKREKAIKIFFYFSNLIARNEMKLAQKYNMFPIATKLENSRFMFSLNSYKNVYIVNKSIITMSLKNYCDLCKTYCDWN